MIELIIKQTQDPTGDETIWKFRQLVFLAVEEEEQGQTYLSPKIFEDNTIFGF